MDRGEIVFIVGPNGAGKSTLLKTVAGLMAPTADSITFNGDAIAGQARAITGEVKARPEIGEVSHRFLVWSIGPELTV
ncbi:hypothetical protein BKP54_21050 [Ensifer sp. 1H6]|nr:hypothetical protein BKP54_21050 [Ensifer sp. 1H6]